MKHKSSRMVALTILYTLIIFGIFIIQFTIGKTFSYKIESMVIKGRHEVDEKGNTKPLLPLSIVANGLNFYVSEQATIIAETANKNQIPLKILSYEKNENTFKISCTHNVKINFSATKRKKIDSVQITANIPTNIINIYIPWKLTPTARLERTETNIFLRYGKNKFTFKGSYGFKNTGNNTNSEFPYLVLSNKSPIAFYETFAKSKKADFESIPQNEMASETMFIQTMNNYRKNALEYFNNSISSKSYNEDIAVAYIAEQASRQKYENALRIAPLTNLPKKERTYKSCTFYNNLEKNERSLYNENKIKLNNIYSIINKNDIKIFREYKLLPFLLDNLKENFLPKMEKIINSSAEENLTANICAGILEVAMDYSIYFPNRKNPFTARMEKYEKKLTDSLLFTDAGLYISSDSKQIDTKQTLKIASILMRYGQETANKKIWKSVGQMLYTSILNYSGESASLPAFFNIQGLNEDKIGLMANDNIILYAEQLYPLIVTTNKNYPHRENLVAQSERGIWAWTCADKFEVTENTSKIFKFRVSFKQGQGHHLIIRGIKPFYRIKIYGLNYKSDPRFEIYKSSGYIYNYAEKTLLLKLQHKQTTEEITLFLGEPPQPKPEPKPENTEISEVNDQSDKDSKEVKPPEKLEE